MPLLASSSTQVLLIKARQKLGMTQQQFSDAVGSSVRTVSRWEDGSSSPAPWHFHKLAAHLCPVDPALAHDAAYLGGKTLEELGLVERPAPPAPTHPAAIHRHVAAAGPPRRASHARSRRRGLVRGHRGARRFARDVRYRPRCGPRGIRSRA
jgi:transcriptional regulator with XRE-family HTH domain